MDPEAAKRILINLGGAKLLATGVEIEGVVLTEEKLLVEAAKSLLFQIQDRGSAIESPEEDEKSARGHRMYRHEETLFRLEVARLFSRKYIYTIIKNKEMAASCNFTWSSREMNVFNPNIDQTMPIKTGIVWAVRINGEINPSYVITKPDEPVVAPDASRCLADVLWTHRHDEIEIVQMNVFLVGNAADRCSSSFSTKWLGTYHEPSNHQARHDKEYGYLAIIQDPSVMPDRRYSPTDINTGCQVNVDKLVRLVSWKPAINYSKEDGFFTRSWVCGYNPKDFGQPVEILFGGPHKLYREDIQSNQQWVMGFDWMWRGCPAKILREEMRDSTTSLTLGLVERLTGEMPLLRLTVGFIGEVGTPCEIREFEELSRVCQQIAGRGARWNLYQGRTRIKGMRDINMAAGNSLSLVLLEE